MQKMNDQELFFTDDELNLMMIYSPGSREGLIAELTKMQSQLTGRDKELRRCAMSFISAPTLKQMPPWCRKSCGRQSLPHNRKGTR